MLLRTLFRSRMAHAIKHMSLNCLIALLVHVTLLRRAVYALFGTHLLHVVLIHICLEYFPNTSTEFDL